MLVDLIKNFINALLRKIRGSCVRFPFAFIKQFFFYFFGWLVRVKKIIDPIKKTIHANAPIKTLPHKKDKKKTSETAGKMCNMPTGVAYRNKCEVDDKINRSTHPKRNAAIKHWKNAITRRQHSCCHYNCHNTC